MFQTLRPAVAGLVIVVALTGLALSGGSPLPTSPKDPPVNPEPLAPAGPRFWKGNLHTHTLWSDGDDFPEMVADWYKNHGYDFLALTDHNVLSEGEKWADAGDEGTPRARAVARYAERFGEAWLERRRGEKDRPQVRLKPLREFRSLLEEPGKFLLVPAEEITHRYAKAPVHVNGFNLRDPITPTDADSIAETIRVHLRAVAEQGRRTGWRTAAALNHPNFGWGVRAEDLAAAEELRFVEVFNGHPGVRNYGDATHVSCEQLWDIALALRLGKLGLPIVYGLATDDAHGYLEFGPGKVNPGRGWVMVRTRYLSAESIIRALDAGDFYGTTGVVLEEVRRDGDELRIDIRGEEGIRYRTEFVATLKDAPLESKPRLDADGNPLPVTREYGAEVGKVIATADGTRPRYRLTGKELYVRARIISTKPHPNPYAKGDVEVAWTQPVVP
jgi:hypothetical protein